MHGLVNAEPKTSAEYGMMGAEKRTLPRNVACNLIYPQGVHRRRITITELIIISERQRIFLCLSSFSECEIRKKLDRISVNR